MAIANALDINDAPINFGKPNGLHWITAALFLIGDMTGAGIVAFPVAMVRSGSFVGIITIILLAITFCYTACVLSNNWLIMCNRWAIYAKHCRKPYPEMAYRAMVSGKVPGKITKEKEIHWRLICSWILNSVLFGVAVVFCLLAASIINDFIISITNYEIGFCYVLILLVLAIYPVTLLRSPQDFWWALVLAMMTTVFAVLLIFFGSWMDYGKCTASDEKLNFDLDGIIASLGTFLFGFGGHVIFPSVQHDMKYPKHFIRSAFVAFTAIACIYLLVSIVGYEAYGSSLRASVINFIQTDWIRQCANLLIGINCILTFTIVINPINQEAESFFKAPHHFGWHRLIIRTIVILTILFVAETVPKFGPILNIIGGTTVALTSATLPLIYNHYLIASIHDPVTNTYKRPTFPQVLQRNSKTKLLIDFTVIVISMNLGIATTYTAIVDLSSTDFTMPCYLSFLENASRNTSVELQWQQCKRQP